MNDSAPNYPISSVDSALRLLLMFRDRKSIRITDASDELGVARSTAHRLMSMLTLHGFVRHDPKTRTYLPGRALVDVGLAVVRQMDVRTVAKPAMERLSAETGETVHLARFDSPNVVFIDCVESSRAIRVGSRVGTVMPAHCTSVGKAMMAATPNVLDDYFAGQRLPTLTEHSIQNRQDLKQALQAIERRGFAKSEQESEDGLRSVGVAILDRSGYVVGGLSVAAPIQRLQRSALDKLGELARAAAQEIGQALD